jgi:DNA-binding NarL/FixJ family response regulator
MPAMLRAIVDDLLAQESDFVVVGSSQPDEDPLLGARENQADMLITEDGSETGATCLHAIMCGPPISIFAIAADGRDASAISLVRKEITFDPAKQATFADAIRRVAGEH